MKYIKLYEAYKLGDEKRTEELFSSLIDWDMIENIKDMSLEYLDEGKILCIGIAYDEDKKKRDPWLQYYYRSPVNNDHIAYITFTHRNYNIKWIKFYLEDKVTSDYISYNFYLYKEPNGPYIRNTNELVKRIKLAYPDKNIKSALR